jgi:hypothetical protein
MRTESESLTPSGVDMDYLRGMRRMEELEARRKICGHVVILLWKRGVRQERRVLCVRRGVKSEYTCL